MCNVKWCMSTNPIAVSTAGHVLFHVSRISDLCYSWGEGGDFFPDSYNCIFK